MAQRAVERGGFALTLVGTFFLDVIAFALESIGAGPLAIIVFVGGGFVAAHVAWDHGRRSKVTTFGLAVFNALLPVVALGLFLLVLAYGDWSF